MEDKLAKESVNLIQKKLLESFDGNIIFDSFEYPEKGFKETFANIDIPWYLKPFKNSIREVCAEYVAIRKFSGSNVVTLRRPKAFKNER